MVGMDEGRRCVAYLVVCIVSIDVYTESLIRGYVLRTSIWIYVWVYLISTHGYKCTDRMYSVDDNDICNYVYHINIHAMRLH